MSGKQIHLFSNKFIASCIPFELPWNGGFSCDILTFYDIRDFSLSLFMLRSAMLLSPLRIDSVIRLIRLSSQNSFLFVTWRGLTSIRLYWSCFPRPGTFPRNSGPKACNWTLCCLTWSAVFSTFLIFSSRELVISESSWMKNLLWLGKNWDIS